MRRDVSDEQATWIMSAVDEQRRSIVTSLERLASRLDFVDAPDADVLGSLARPDVLLSKGASGELFLFVGLARGFAEPAHDESHQQSVRDWLRRFARLVHVHGRAEPSIAGGYLVVGTHDDASAYAWASLRTKAARPHRLHRDGARAQFVARRVGSCWIAC